MAINTADIANSLIQTTIQKVLTTPLEAASSFLASGPRIVDTAAPVKFPRLKGFFSTNFVAESALIPTETGPTFDAVSLMPSTMQKIAVLCRMSNESLRESSLALDSILQDRLVRDVQARLDAQAWGAAGDGIATPRGVLAPANVSEFHKIDAAGPLSLDHLHDAYGAALADDVPLSGLRWVLSPQMLTSLRKVKQATGSRQYVLTEDVTQGPAGLRLLGVPVSVTKRLAPSGTTASPKEHVLLWSPSTWVVARDLSAQVVVDRSRFLEYDETALRVITRFDWKPLQGEANVLIQNAAPAAA